MGEQVLLHMYLGFLSQRWGNFQEHVIKKIINSVSQRWLLPIFRIMWIWNVFKCLEFIVLYLMLLLGSTRQFVRMDYADAVWNIDSCVASSQLLSTQNIIVKFPWVCNIVSCDCHIRMVAIDVHPSVVSVGVLSFRIVFMFSCLVSYSCTMCVEIVVRLGILYCGSSSIMRSRNNTNWPHILANKSCYLVSDSIFTSCWHGACWRCWVEGRQSR